MHRAPRFVPVILAVVLSIPFLAATPGSVHAAACYWSSTFTIESTASPNAGVQTIINVRYRYGYNCYGTRIYTQVTRIKTSVRYSGALVGGTHKNEERAVFKYVNHSGLDPVGSLAWYRNSPQPSCKVGSSGSCTIPILTEYPNVTMVYDVRAAVAMHIRGCDWGQGAGFCNVYYHFLQGKYYVYRGGGGWGNG